MVAPTTVSLGEAPLGVHSSPMLIHFYKKRIKKLRKLALQPDVHLWTLNEVHFRQHVSRCRMWVPPEVKEPVCCMRRGDVCPGYDGARDQNSRTPALPGRASRCRLAPPQARTSPIKA